MSAQFIVDVADLKPEGSDKTYRQLNSEKIHNIPLGALVEVRSYNVDLDSFEDNPFGLRLYVVEHSRDCDQTPLYSLSHMTLTEYLSELEFLQGCRLEVQEQYLMKATTVKVSVPGYCEEALKVLHLTPPTN